MQQQSARTHKHNTTPSLNALSNAFLSRSSPCPPWFPTVPIPIPAHDRSVLTNPLNLISTSSHPIDGWVFTAGGSGLAISLNTNELACRIAWRPSEIGYEIARLWVVVVVQLEDEKDEAEEGDRG